MAQIKEPQQGEAPGEDTNVYVKRLLASRGRTRRPVMVLLTIAAVLLTLMALKWGSRRHEDLTMMGPVYDQKAGDTVVHEDAPPPAPPQKKPAQKVAGAPAEVEVNLENGGDLWVDGRELSSRTRKHELMLAPGAHTLTVHQDGRILTQKITVAPNDVLEVTFGQKIKVMRRAD